MLIVTLQNLKTYQSTKMMIINIFFFLYIVDDMIHSKSNPLIFQNEQMKFQEYDRIILERIEFPCELLQREGYL